MNYYHAIDLDNFFPCWNLGLDGKLRTPNFLSMIEPEIGKVHKSINEYSIDELSINGPDSSVLTPRTASAIIKGAILRRGQVLANGYGQVINISDDERSHILKCSDVELEFERIRREVLPESVSRLSCIWLAERTREGEDHIKKMLGYNVYLLQVAITHQVNLTRVDTGWFDSYWETGNEDDIRGYWSGEPFSSKQQWEYLLDGEIKVVNKEQLDYIKQHGTKMA